MGPITSWKGLQNALRRQSWLILLILAVGLPGVYWFAKTRPAAYEAQGVLGIDVPQGASGQAGAGSGPMVGRRLDEIEQSLLSREALLALAQKFKLFDEQSETGRARMMRDSISFVRLADDAQSWNPDVLPYGVSITTRLGEADAAAAVTNALLDAAMAEDARRLREDIDSAIQRQRVVLDYLAEEESRVDTEMDGAEAQLADLRAARADSLPENIEKQRTRLDDLKAQQAAAERQLQSFESSQSQLNPDLASRRREQIEQQRASLQAEIDAIEAAIDAAPEVEQQLAALNRTIRGLEAELTAITGQRTQAELGRQLGSLDQAARLYILEPAVAPDIPVSRSRSKLAMAGGMGVLFLAFALALGREVLHPGIRSAAQMKAQIGVEPVVVIPFVRSPSATNWRLAGLALLAVTLMTLAAWPF